MLSCFQPAHLLESHIRQQLSSTVPSPSGIAPRRPPARTTGLSCCRASSRPTCWRATSGSSCRAPCLRLRALHPVMCENSIALFLHQLRQWRARGRHARSLEAIGRIIVLARVEGTTVTQGVERAGQGAVVEDVALAAAARSRASLDRAPDRTGCDATGCGMVTDIERSAVRRVPLGPSLAKIPPLRPRPWVRGARRSSRSTGPNATPMII